MFCQAEKVKQQKRSDSSPLIRIEDAQGEFGTSAVRRGYVLAIPHNIFFPSAVTNRCNNRRMLEEIRIRHVMEFLRSEGLAEPTESPVARIRAQPSEVLDQPRFISGPDRANIQASSSSQGRFNTI